MDVDTPWDAVRIAISHSLFGIPTIVPECLAAKNRCGLVVGQSDPLPVGWWACNIVRCSNGMGAYWTHPGIRYNG